MLPVREEDVEARRYQEHLGIVRERILGFVVRRLVPHLADFAHAEDIAQSCVVVLWEQYPDKRELGEMVRIAIGIARHKMAQFHRERERTPDDSDLAALPWDDRLVERISAREETDRLLLGMLKLNQRCRDLLRLKLIEQRSYDEIRELTGITGNVYEIARRCFKALLRHVGGN
jgi:RNA polymerase sigma factor (sigma-70 family)